MEKEDAYTASPDPEGGKRARHSRLWKAIIVGIFITALLNRPKSGTWFPLAARPAPSPQDDFSWDVLFNSPTLEYADCYAERNDDVPLQCARLELPMDYWNDTTNAKISLAVIRKPAKVDVLSKQYGGAVLLNPGGPGGSGIALLLNAGNATSNTIDAVEGSDGKFYDLISFDPRGVGLSQPAIECIKDKQWDHAWQLRVMEEGVYEASDASFGRLWSMSQARAGSCSLPLPDDEADIRKYVTTASVARDMLEIVERHGEWREREAKRLLGASSGCGKTKATVAQAAEVLKTVAYKPGGEKLQYWGFSYGTYLGNTFAAMFPDRVHRVVVDGVVDAYNYKKALWSDNLIDTEADWNGFYYHCARAGYPACALANATGKTTAQGVSDRVANITNSLYHNPLPIISPHPEVITYSDIKNLIFAGVYSPIQSFPYIANILAAIEQGDGTEFAKLLRGYHEFQCPGQGGQGFSIIPLRNLTRGVAMSYDSTMAIACSDGDDQSFVNRTYFREYAKKLAKVSPTVGSMWATVRLSCAHYSVRPYHRFEGPWVGNTSHPLLMIGNTADPVTPVKHARNMAKGFPGAVALTQDSGGHCSSNTFSNCTVQYIKQYFQTGVLPPPDTLCAADEMPFGPDPDDSSDVSDEILELRQRHRTIGAAMEASSGSGGLRGGLADRWLE